MFELSFTQALTNPIAPPPIGVSKDVKRFNIYKNNVTLSLKEGMKANFPCVLKLVGEDFFDFLSTTYLKQHPPSSKLMFQLGEHFPAFIKTITQAEDLPFLSDIANLEQCLRLSYHAKDAASLTLEDFQKIPPESLGEMCFALSPSFHLLKSETPFITIYEDCMGINPQDDILFEPEFGFVARHNFEVDIKIIDEQTYLFLQNLMVSKPLASCLEENSDASSLLTFLINSNITTGNTHEKPH